MKTNAKEVSEQFDHNHTQIQAPPCLSAGPEPSMVYWAGKIIGLLKYERERRETWDESHFERR